MRGIKGGRLSALALAATLVAAIAAMVPLAASPVGAAGGGLEAIPHYDHIAVLVLENESAATTFGAGSPATYLNGTLRPAGAFVQNYYGTGHVSLDNYISMTSGQPSNGLTNTDCAVVSLYVCSTSTSIIGNGRNVADQLEGAGLSWRSYMDGTSTPCFHGPYGTDLLTLLKPDPYQGDSAAPPAFNYADRHNPFIYYKDFIGNPARCAAHQRPYTDLAGDLSAGTLPAFSFITPDTCHDGHDSPCAGGAGPGGLVGADAWLRTNVPPLLSYLQAHNGLLVVTFDEGGLGTGISGLNDLLCLSCVSLGIGGRTGTLMIGPGITPGTTVTASYDHYSLLRTIEDSFGIGEHLNLAGLATPMAAVFH